MRPSEQQMMSLGLALLGLTLLASGVLSADLAREHMAALGRLCGAGEAAHCGWCYAAVGFGLAGLSALIAAARPTAAKSVAS